MLNKHFRDKMEPHKTYQILSVHESGWCHGHPLKTTKKKVGGKEVEEMSIDKLTKFMVHESALKTRYDQVEFKAG